MTGRLAEDLRVAALECLELSRAACAEHGRSQDWRVSASYFLEQTVDALPVAGVQALGNPWARKANH